MANRKNVEHLEICINSTEYGVHEIDSLERLKSRNSSNNMTMQTHRASGPAVLLSIPNSSSPIRAKPASYLNPRELDRPALGTGSMLSRLPLLLAVDEGGLVTVRLESGLDPMSVDLSSSGDSGS